MLYLYIANKRTRHLLNDLSAEWYCVIVLSSCRTDTSEWVSHSQKENANTSILFPRRVRKCHCERCLYIRVIVREILKEKIVGKQKSDTETTKEKEMALFVGVTLPVLVPPRGPDTLQIQFHANKKTAGSFLLRLHTVRVIDRTLLKSICWFGDRSVKR